MQLLFRTIRKVASTDAPVFISGESGTGKELTAVAIPESARRARTGELINRVRRAIVMADGRLLSAMDFDLGDYTSQQAVTINDVRESADQAASAVAVPGAGSRDARREDDGEDGGPKEPPRH
ncbi:MAG: sigma 54-interacting transcriptional regulator [Burkholderia sp.]